MLVSSMSTTLQHIGKTAGQPLVAASVTGQSHSCLFYIIDRNNRLHLLVDTGAEVSVVPPINTERKHQQDGFTVKHIQIKTYGTWLITLNLNLCQTFRWPSLFMDHLKPAYLDTEFSLLDTTSTHSLPHTATSNPVTTTHLRRKFCWPSNLLDQPLIVH